MKKLGVFVLGIITGAAVVIAGVAVAVPAIRGSRNPDTLPGRVRTTLTYPPPPFRPPGFEQADLIRRYGPDRQSQGPEEWIVRDFFNDKRGGVFVDVGAAEERVNNNTWFLEKKLGWSGVAIDAQDKYRREWERYRPRSRFVTFFVSDRSDQQVRLSLTTDSYVASFQESWTRKFGAVVGSVEVPSISLDDLLSHMHVATFDFLSMDIELAEPRALAGLDVERFKPALVCVEAQAEVRQQILDYFAVHHYSVVGKYLRADVTNLWFMPLGTTPRPSALQQDSSP